MGIRITDIVPNVKLPRCVDTTMCNNHDFRLIPVKYNKCTLLDWTRGRYKQMLCDIRLPDGYFCMFNHSPKNPGITFRKEVLGKNLGEVIGFAPFKDDLSGIRDDIDYDFLDIEYETIPGYEHAGTMQKLTLRAATGMRLVCD